MPIGLIRLINTQKVLKTCNKQGIKRHFLGSNHNLQEKKNGSKFKRLVEAPDYQKIVDILTDGKGKWNATRKNPHESIARGALT